MGLAWLFRRFSRPVAEPKAPADPAEELRQKLADSRTADIAPGTDAGPEPEASLDERRRTVHDRARAAIDEMHGGAQAPPGDQG